MRIFGALVSVVCLLVLPVMIESCCMTGACCGDPPPQSFDIKDIKMNTVFRGNYPDAPIKDSLILKSLELRFSLEIENLAQLKNTYRPTMAAFACDYDVAKSDEFLTGYTIRSDNEIIIGNNTLAAGEDISSKFNLSGMYNTSLPSRLVQNGVAFTSDFDVSKRSDHVFTVRLVFGDGRIFEFETKKFRLIPQ